jgi:hypothetical protein
MGTVTSIHARAAAVSGRPHTAHRGHRCEYAAEVEALRAEVAGLRAVVQRQAGASDGTALAVMDIAFAAGRDSARRALGLTAPRGPARR